MTSVRLSRRGRWTEALQVERVALWVLVALLGVVAVALLVSPETFDLPGLFGDHTGALLAGASIYLLSHVLRFLRLAVLCYRPGVRMRHILEVEFFTAGLGVVLPFKLADLVRIRELGVVLGDIRAGLVVVWMERAFDAAMLAVLVGVCAVALPGSLEVLTPLLVVVCLFVVLTVVVLFVLPPNLRIAMLHVVRRPTGERGVALLVAMRGVLDVIQPAPQLLRGRFATLVFLTVLIWAAEVCVVSVAVPGIGADVSQVATGLLSLLASLSSGATLLMPASADRLTEALARFGTGADVGTYREVLTLPALLAGVAAGVPYLLWRPRAPGRTA